MSTTIALLAFKWPLQFCAFSTLATYVASLVTGNVSQVDRVWTFLPTIYTAYFALLPLWPTQNLPLLPFVPEELSDVAKTYSPRAVTMMVLVTVWMFRLSYNTYRRGLFNLKDEDYRWAILRTKIPAWLYQVFNLTFIAIIQNVLLLSLAYPTYLAAVVQPHTQLSASDLFLSGLSLVILALEFTSDNQQYSYHAYKHAYLGKAAEAYDEKKQWPGSRLSWTPADAKRGFLTRGLWAWCRHPNFACEQSFWWIISLMPCLCPDAPFLPSYTAQETSAYFAALKSSSDFGAKIYNDGYHFLVEIGPILPVIALTALFISSTAFTEGISMSKYPTGYTAYQQRVSKFSPMETFIWGFVWSPFAPKREDVELLVWGDVDARKIKKT